IRHHQGEGRKPSWPSLQPRRLSQYIPSRAAAIRRGNHCASISQKRHRHFPMPPLPSLLSLQRRRISPVEVAVLP
ncbi:hypothetical protein Droror1_Dr00026777, partial [Drosera rotundifolia]